MGVGRVGATGASARAPGNVSRAAGAVGTCPMATVDIARQVTDAAIARTAIDISPTVADKDTQLPVVPFGRCQNYRKFLSLPYSPTRPRTIIASDRPLRIT